MTASRSRSVPAEVSTERSGDNPNLKRDLRSSSWDCFFVNIMVGGGETFVPAFGLAMGLSDEGAGLLTALPFLLGSTLQLAAPRLLSKVGSYRKWIVSLCSIQGLCLLGFMLVALSDVFSGAASGVLPTGASSPLYALYAISAVYWACSLAAGPAWNAWMATLVPTEIRAQYFAKRNHLGQIGLLGGLLIAGFLLERARSDGWEMLAFAILFLTAALFRFTSVFHLSRKSERPEIVKEQKRVPVLDLLSRLRKGQDGRTIGFLLFFSVAVNVAGPFFNPYMLDHLKLSYTSYMALIASVYVAKMLTFGLLSRRTDAVDPYSYMRWGIIGIAIVPFLWMISRDLFFLGCLQALSGVAWGLFDLGVILVLFGTVRDEEKTSFLSYYNFASAFMILLGTTMGGRLLGVFGESDQTYFIVFGLSGFARVICYFIFRRVAPSNGNRSSGSSFERSSGSRHLRIAFSRLRVR